MTARNSCAQVDPEIFFPNNNFVIKEQIRTATNICKQCHLLTACSEYAERQPSLYGVWGGKMYDGSNYKSPVFVIHTNKVA
jgi:hypothetical protein